MNALFIKELFCLYLDVCKLIRLVIHVIGWILYFTEPLKYGLKILLKKKQQLLKNTWECDEKILC